MRTSPRLARRAVFPAASKPLGTARRCAARLPIFAAVLLASGRLAEAGDLELPPLFAHNMVLQQGTVNSLWGKGPAGQYVELQYKFLKTGNYISKSGRWKLRLDLSGLTDVEPADLFLSVGQKKRLHLDQTLTNVAVGDVLLLGVLGKGVPFQLDPDPEQRAEFLKPKENPIHYLRFISIPDCNHFEEACSTVPATWHLCVPDAPDFQDLSAWAFIWAYTQANRPLGIVQTGADDLLRGLRSSRPSLSQKRRQRWQELDDNRLVVYPQATNQVALVERRNEDIRFEAKRRGSVTNLPPIVPYGNFDVYLSDDFDPHKPPAAFLTFDAALW